MTFLKPVPNHWVPGDFDVSKVAAVGSLLHITKTICLLESRCDNYAEYLRAIFRNRAPEWNQAIDQWNAEECQHGEVLRALSESADRGFRFDQLMPEYEGLVSYHAADGESVRGSVGAEMIARCVVEALASALYRALADATEDATCREVYLALAQDEARHFGMFLRMLEAEAASTQELGVRVRVRHAIGRILALEDGQIMMASCVVAGRFQGEIRRRREANWYLGRLYPFYRWRHLRYAVQMLTRTVGLGHSRVLAEAGTAGLWVALKARWAWAALCNRVVGAR